MKTLKNFRNLTFLFLGLILITSCSNDDGPAPFVPTNNIVELAQATAELSDLVDALVKYPDLVTLLSGNGTFTVFAPTNTAFDGLLAALGQTSIDDIPEDVLKNVLQYHVFTTAAVEASAVVTGPITMANGEVADLVSDNNGVTVQGANVVLANVLGTNGIVHVIDSVIVPPSVLPIVGTIVAPAYFNKDFTTLIAAVNAADPSILTLLLSDGTDGNGLTLFAPTNDAFSAAGITDLSAVTDIVDAVLAYHVIDGATIMASMLPDTDGSAAEVGTVGGNIYVTNAGSGVFINGTTEVVATDITGSNGVVHIIDKTLVPPTKSIGEIVGDFVAADSPEFTFLAAALGTASGAVDLSAALSTDGIFTVFAPTDQAFIDAGFPDVAAINAADPAFLFGVLTHHVIESSAYVFSTDLSDGAVPMLNMQDVTIDLGTLTVQDANGSDPAAGLVPTLLNVHATNGVVHVINKVLLPSS